MLSTGAAATLTPAEGAVVNVENLVVTALTAAQTIQFAEADGTKVGISGVTSITNLASTVALSFTNLTSIPAITLNNTGADTTVSFAKGALSGTADTVTLNVSGNAAAATVTLTPTAGEDIENLVVNSTNAASTVTAAGVRGATLKTVTVTGDADISFGATASFNIATSFDGSTATGGITASFATFGSGTTNAQTISTGAGKDTITLGQNGAQYTSITVNTGAGNDKIIVGDTLSIKHSIDGGAGKDTIAVTMTGADAQGLAFVNLINNQVTNVEVLEFTNATTAFNANAFSNISEFVVASGRTATLTVNDLKTGDILVDKGGAGDVGSGTGVGTTALSLKALGTKQSVTLDIDGNITGGAGGIGGVGAGTASSPGATGGVAAAAITTDAGIETITLIADTADIAIVGGKGGAGGGAGTGAGDGGAGGAAAVAVANNAATKTLLIQGSKDVSILGGDVGGAGGGTGATGASGSGGAGGAAKAHAFAEAIKIDASKLTGDLNVQGSEKVDEIIGGSGDDTIRASKGNDTIDLSAGGSNTIKFEADGADNGVDTIKGFNVGAVSSGGDKLVVTDFSDIGSSVTIVRIADNATNQKLGDDTVTIVDFGAAIADKDFSSTDFALLFATGKAISTAIDSADDAIVIVQGTDRSEVYLVSNADTTIAAGDVSMVAILDGVTNSDILVAANFA